MNANVTRSENAVAFDVDNTIDRALSALRDAAPRAGFEGRILASLEHRAIAPQPLRPHFSVHLALWAATSAAVLAVASMMVLHHRAAPTEVAQTPRVLAPQIAGSQQTSIEPTHRMVHRAVTTSPAMPARCAHSGCPVHDGDAHTVMNGATPTDLDAQALADLHAPSYPAPPLPLTPQEKLFLRMVRYANATELAELNPLVREKQDADETAAFKAFFPDPPPLQQPTGDTE